MSADAFFDVETSRSWGPLVTSRNNFDNASLTQVSEVGKSAAQATAFRVPRPYVAMCCKGSLGLFYAGGRVVFRALACGSWSCSSCRKVLAARLLDRLRGGMEGRAGGRFFATLTLDPAKFGAVVVGYADWDKQGRACLPEDSVRKTLLWSEPTPKQFAAAVRSMSREFKRLVDSLNRRAAYRGLERWGYFRVVELHRNGWPHYHVVFEHPDLELEHSHIGLWQLGRSDVRPVSLDDAVGEVAPYLVCSEKGGGSKAYQFAASALPKHFRLYSSSAGFLGAPAEHVSTDKPEHALALRGHFTDHHRAVRAEGGESVMLLPTPAAPDRPHRPPASSQASGDAALLYYLRLVEADIEHAPPEWFRQVERKVFKQHYDVL